MTDKNFVINEISENQIEYPNLLFEIKNRPKNIYKISKNYFCK